MERSMTRITSQESGGEEHDADHQSGEWWRGAWLGSPVRRVAERSMTLVTSRVSGGKAHHVALQPGWRMRRRGARPTRMCIKERQHGRVMMEHTTHRE